jgi:hypothetical protein
MAIPAQRDSGGISSPFNFRLAPSDGQNLLDLGVFDFHRDLMGKDIGGADNMVDPGRAIGLFLIGFTQQGDYRGTRAYAWKKI